MKLAAHLCALPLAMMELAAPKKARFPPRLMRRIYDNLMKYQGEIESL